MPKSSQILLNPKWSLLKLPNFLTLCQSGEILPNLVTLLPNVLTLTSFMALNTYLICNIFATFHESLRVDGLRFFIVAVKINHFTAFYLRLNLLENCKKPDRYFGSRNKTTKPIGCNCFHWSTLYFNLLMTLFRLLPG